MSGAAHPEPQRGDLVSLRAVNGETVRAICNLKVSEAQNRFVAPNAVSIAQAYFEPKAWFRAVYAGEAPVGFVMLYDDPGDPAGTDEPEYFLWCFMIDERHQRYGFGRQALLQLIEYVKTRPGAKVLLTSCVPEEGGPEPFYASLGFERNGNMAGSEVVMELKLV